MAKNLRRFIVLVLLEVIADLQIVFGPLAIKSFPAVGIRVTWDIDQVELKSQSAFTPNANQSPVQSRAGNGLNLSLMGRGRTL